MPRFDDESMLQHTIEGTPYGFSATRIEDLGAAEYTLVALIADASPSVQPFRAEIEACVQEIVQSCRRSPRADNLLLRFSTFGRRVREVHGFRELVDCPAGDYTGALKIGRATAAHDAALNGVEAVARYGRDLFDGDFDANAIVFVITDGADNVSKATPQAVQAAVANARTTEVLESIVTILVGVNVHDPQLGKHLEHFRREAGFDAYVELGAADRDTLARLARFVSDSVAAQSQALGTGNSAAVRF